MTPELPSEEREQSVENPFTPLLRARCPAPHNRPLYTSPRSLLLSPAQHQHPFLQEAFPAASTPPGPGIFPRAFHSPHRAHPLPVCAPLPHTSTEGPPSLTTCPPGRAWSQPDTPGMNSSTPWTPRTQDASPPILLPAFTLDSGLHSAGHSSPKTARSARGEEWSLFLTFSHHSQQS